MWKDAIPPRRIVLQPSPFQPIFRGGNIEHLSSESARMLPSVISLGFMLCSLYISCEEDEAHADAETEKTDAPVDKEAATGYVTSLGMIRGGYNHLGKVEKYGIEAFFWVWRRNMKKFFSFQVRCLHNFHPDYGPSKNFHVSHIPLKLGTRTQKGSAFFGELFFSPPTLLQLGGLVSKPWFVAQVHPHEAGCPSFAEKNEGMNDPY